MQQKTRAVFVIIVIVVAIVLVGVWFLGRQSSEGAETNKPYDTCVRLLTLAHYGCERYVKAFGVWPASLTDLSKWEEDLPTRDGWWRQFTFIPYDASRGYGEIISYGRTGKPGGSGEDREFVIRFPLKPNADWDRQQAIGVKLPSQLNGQTNWYEAYFQ